MINKLADTVIASAQRKLLQTELCWGNKDPRIINDLQNLATLYMSLEKLDSAEPVLWRLLELKQQIYGLIHPMVAETLMSLGEFNEANDDYRSSEQFYLGALWILDQSEDFEYSIDLVASLLLKLYWVYKITDNLDGMARVESRLYGCLMRETGKESFAAKILTEQSGPAPVSRNRAGRNTLVQILN